MAYPTLEEIALAAKDWDFLFNLPTTIASFTKELEGTREGDILHLASFKAPALRAKVSLIYSAKTYDYMLVRTLGLNEYLDIRFIYKEKELFAAKVTEKIADILQSMEYPEKENLGEMVQKLHLREWSYGNTLPLRLGAFELYLKPEKATEYINGSLIVLDYSDFEHLDQFTLFYNRHRDEFFAETKIGGVFHATKDFDAKDLKTLEAQLTAHLESTLAAISAADHSL